MHDPPSSHAGSGLPAERSVGERLPAWSALEADGIARDGGCESWISVRPTGFHGHHSFGEGAGGHAVRKALLEQTRCSLAIGSLAEASASGSTGSVTSVELTGAGRLFAHAPGSARRPI